MEKQDRKRRLIQAAQLAEQVLGDLNMQSSLCECCGLTKYEDRGEWQAYQTLESVIEKLRRIANSDVCVERN